MIVKPPMLPDAAAYKCMTIHIITIQISPHYTRPYRGIAILLSQIQPEIATLVPSNSTLVLNSCVSLRLLRRAVESGKSGMLLMLVCGLACCLPEWSLPLVEKGDGDLSSDAMDKRGTLFSVDAITILANEH